MLVIVLAVAGSVTTASASTMSLRVSGNQLIDGAGQPVRLLGVNRSGSEYACVQGWGLFDGPSSAASVAAIAAWHTNAVRVPLNEDCWLGINGVSATYSGAAYRSAIASYVTTLHNAGLYAVLDLHWNAPGTTLATGQQVMADADHAPAFWSSVASTFLGDHAVAFDLYNEPHDISWTCWRDGCTTAAGWRTAGMQSLVDAVRSTGATQPVLVAGLGWGSDLSSWLTYRPTDPAGQLAASTHLYNFSGCQTSSCWDATLAPIAASYPLVTGEVGENDCGHGYTDDYTAWADTHGVSYLGWSWNTASCGSGPALISNFDGTPTAFGVGLRDHLAALASAPAAVQPTPAPAATPTATATASPVSSGFSFEDGTTQGWTTQWGNAGVASSTAEAYSGGHALAVTVAGGYPAVGVRTGLQTLQPGSRVTVHVRIPAGGPTVVVEPFTQDSAWVTTKAPAASAVSGAWTTVSWTVPASGAVTVLGLQMNAANYSGEIDIDAVTWTPPQATTFEDGMTAGWASQWGSSTVGTTATAARKGTRSLAITVGGGYPAVGTRKLNGVGAGSTVTGWVQLPVGAPPFSVEPFSQDGSYVVRKEAAVRLTAGSWTKISWSVPAQGTVTVLGLQVDAGNWNGTVYLDDLSW